MQTDSKRTHLGIAWGTVVCIGLSILLTLVASLLTPDANMIASTISDVAAGPYDWVQDLGLYILAFGLFSLAYGMSLLSGGDWHWKVAMLTMPIMATAVVVMGFYEEYGDGDSNSQGIVIHGYLVYTFGISFLVLLVFSIPTLKQHHGWWQSFNIVFACVWTALAVYYFNMGTKWDGLVERIIGFAYLGWLFFLAWRIAIEADSPAGKRAAEITGTLSD